MGKSSGVVAPKQTVLFASRLLKASEIRETCRKSKTLLTAGKELEATIVMLRIAGKRSMEFEMKGARAWQPLQQ